MGALTGEPVMVTARFRFYGQLRDFLPPERRGRFFTHAVKGCPAVKDTLEALGVPHTEIDAVFANRRPADFSHRLQPGERIEAYPLHYPHRRVGVRHLTPRLRGRPRFVVDSHLGRLVRHLRLLGFDSDYRRIFPDREIVQIADREGRIVLTRDIGLLKNKRIRQGYWVRHTSAVRQLKEVLRRYDLPKKIQPFSRCLECNGRIARIVKRRVEQNLPRRVVLYYNKFYICRGCAKIYWQGSHYDKLMKLVERISPK